MLVNKFKEIAESLGWHFNYGDYSWQNLQDMFDDTGTVDNDGLLVENLPAGLPHNYYFLLLWKDREKEFNDFNEIVAEIFSGEFLLVERSNMDDPDYNFKYETHISRMENMLDDFQGHIQDCDGLQIKGWLETEVVNELDTNVDGIKVKFRIRHEF